MHYLHSQLHVGSDMPASTVLLRSHPREMIAWIENATGFYGTERLVMSITRFSSKLAREGNDMWVGVKVSDRMQSVVERCQLVR